MTSMKLTCIVVLPLGDWRTRARNRKPAFAAASTAVGPDTRTTRHFAQPRWFARTAQRSSPKTALWVTEKCAMTAMYLYIGAELCEKCGQTRLTELTIIMLVMNMESNSETGNETERQTID